MYIYICVEQFRQLRKGLAKSHKGSTSIETLVKDFLATATSLQLLGIDEVANKDHIGCGEFGWEGELHWTKANCIQPAVLDSHVQASPSLHTSLCHVHLLPHTFRTALLLQAQQSRQVPLLRWARTPAKTTLCI